MSLIQKFIELLLTPTLNKKVKEYKGTAAYKELEQEVKQSIESIEQITKRLERTVKEQEDTIKKANDLGWKLKPWNSTEELLKQIKDRPGREEALKKLGL
jgi:gas vesicle protein